MNKFKVGDWVVRNDTPDGPNNPKFRKPCQITSIGTEWGVYLRFDGHAAGWRAESFEKCLPPDIEFNPDDYL